MFLAEARIARRLYHPAVCHMYEAGEIDGSYFMAMEWVHGVPLRRLIRHARDHGGIPLPIALKIMVQVSEALDYVHHICDADGRPLEIIHRDVSPHNVMVSYAGYVKLLDFGIAKATIAQDATEVGVIKGKYAYLSPEQCRGEKVDRRSDIFALGICLYETATGKPIYHRDSALATMSAIVYDPVPTAPQLPPEVDAIVQRALQKSPDDRFQSAHEMRTALDGYLTSCGQQVDAGHVAALLDWLFDEEERMPLPVPAATGTQPVVSMSTAPPSAQSGSFGPFGQSPRLAPTGGEVEVELVDLDRPKAPAEVVVAAPAPRAGARRRWLWVIGAALLIAAALAAAIVTGHP
jgi:serine/threonine-protein kinase